MLKNGAFWTRLYVGLARKMIKMLQNGAFWTRLYIGLAQKMMKHAQKWSILDQTVYRISSELHETVDLRKFGALTGSRVLSGAHGCSERKWDGNYQE